MKIGIMTILMVLTSCSKVDAFMISGENYTYEIANLYLGSETFSVFGNQFSGDEGKVIALKVPIYTGINSSSEDISILIYLDRKYVLEDDIYIFSKKMVADASRVPDGEKPEIYKYEEKLGSSRTVYLSSFDPLNESTLNRSPYDYFAEVTKTASLVIGAHDVSESKESCKLFMLIDSMLIQIGGVGSVCEANELSVIPKKIYKLFSIWRQRTIN
tara:strand:+ start:386 stop:1030 length:645 start_codon:yes stop_codon:yes gene_type:complete